MNKLLVSLLASILAITGCSREPKGTGLTREILLTLDASKVNEICILSISERGAIRRYNFFILKLTDFLAWDFGR